MKNKIKELEEENKDLKKRLEATEKLARTFAVRSLILGIIMVVLATIILLISFK